MKPVLVEVATMLDGQVRVAQLNVDEEQEIASRSMCGASPPAH